MTERVLTLRELNRPTLARQLLLERKRARRAWRGARIRAHLLHHHESAFGPASRRDIVAWSMMHVPEIGRALDRLEHGCVVPEPFSTLPRSARRELEDEAGRLESFLAG